MQIEVSDEEIVKRAAAIWGRRGGKVRSAKKARAVRKNGKMGGRPKGTKKS